VFQNANPKNLEQWTPDGKYLVINSAPEKTPSDVYVLRMDGDPKPEAYLNLPYLEDMARVSPNGKWIAYRSTESGNSEVYVQTFKPGETDPRRKWRISTDGGLEPQWRSDSKELYYLRGSTLMAVDIKSDGDELIAGLPKPLFDKLLPGPTRNRYLVSKDGQRILMITPPDDHRKSNIHVLVNWQNALRK
jgi:eukaryotic-like serine/threonine-protein kinase